MVTAWAPWESGASANFERRTVGQSKSRIASFIVPVGRQNCVSYDVRRPKAGLDEKVFDCVWSGAGFHCGREEERIALTVDYEVLEADKGSTMTGRMGKERERCCSEMMVAYREAIAMTYNYTQTVVLVVAGWLRSRLSCFAHRPDRPGNQGTMDS